MKKLTSIMALVSIMILSFNKTNAAPPGGSGGATTFWLSVSAVNQIVNSGATTLKIYAATDPAGNLCYIMVGGDENYNTLPGTVFMQNNKGICPPICDFSGVDLSAPNNASIEATQGQAYIDAYQGQFGGNNCTKFTISSLGNIRTNSTYIKVTLSTATANGLKSDGTAISRATATGTSTSSDL